MATRLSSPSAPSPVRQQPANHCRCRGATLRHCMLAVAGALCLSFAIAQEFSGAATFLSLDESLAWSLPVPLPTLAFHDEACRGQGVDFLTDQQVSTVQRHYESATDNVRIFLEFSPWCLTIVDITRAEAHRVIAEILHEMREMEILSLEQGYWGPSYAWVRVIEAPDVFLTDFMVAAEHGPDFTVDPYHFGFIIFEYLPERRWLRLHSHRYTYSPGA